MDRISCMGWTFSFHRDRTRRLNRTLPQADPEICDCLPELCRLLEQLGLDLQRPVSQCSEDGACYLFLGTAHAPDGFELDFYGPGRYQSVVVHPCPQGYREDGLDIREPCVLLEVFGLKGQGRGRTI